MRTREEFEKLVEDADILHATLEEQCMYDPDWVRDCMIPDFLDDLAYRYADELRTDQQRRLYNAAVAWYEYAQAAIHRMAIKRRFDKGYHFDCELNRIIY